MISSRPSTWVMDSRSSEEVPVTLSPLGRVTVIGPLRVKSNSSAMVVSTSPVDTGSGFSSGGGKLSPLELTKPPESERAKPSMKAAMGSSTGAVKAVADSLMIWNSGSAPSLTKGQMPVVRPNSMRTFGMETEKDTASASDTTGPGVPMPESSNSTSKASMSTLEKATPDSAGSTSSKPFTPA